MSDALSRERFDRRLGSLHAAARRRALLRGLLATVAIGAGAFGAAAWAVGGDTEPSATWRVWMLGGVALLTARSLHAHWWQPLRALRDRAALSRLLDHDGALRNLTVAAEEAGRRPERWGAAAGVPAALRERLYAGATQAIAGVRLGRRMPLRGVWAGVVGAAVTAAALLLLAAAAPERLSRGAARLLHPWRPDAPPAEVGLYLVRPELSVVAGTDAELAARDFGRPRNGVICEVRVGEGLWQPLAARREHRPYAPYDLWIARLPAARESFAYRFRRDGMTTPAGWADVVHPPLLAAWGGRLSPPSYTRLPAQALPQLPSRLRAPEGSRLAWEGFARGRLAWASVVPTAGDTLPLLVRGDTLRGEARLCASLQYTVALRDERGLENAPRVIYAVDVVPDAPPVATLAREGDDGRLPAEGPVRLSAQASDDWGVSRLSLLLRRESAGAVVPDSAQAAVGWSSLTIWPTPARGGPASPADSLDTPWGTVAVRAEGPAGPLSAGPLAFDLALDVARLDLLPGDALAVCVEALDNRQPGPPGRGRSAVVRLVLPSAADLLAEQMGEGEKRADGLDLLRSRGEDLGQQLEELARELKKEPTPAWEKRQQLQAALEQQRALREEFRRVAGELQRDIERMAREDLGSVALLEKMQQVSELIEQVESRELDQLLAQLREQARSLTPEEVRAAIEAAARDRQEYEQRLDRAIGLLRELVREQQMQGLTSVTERLLREQQTLIDAARADSAGARASARDEDRQTQGQRQAALADEARKLAEQVREALARLRAEQQEGGAPRSPAADEMRRALEEAARRLEQGRPDRPMDEAARDLHEKTPPASPVEAQQQALRELAALYHVLLKGQSGMQMAMEQHAKLSLRRLAADLLALSAREEEIAGKVPSDLRGVAAGDLTRGQNRILKATLAVQERLQALGTQSPAVSMRLLRDLSKLVDHLDAAVRALEIGIGALAGRQARECLGDLNRMVIGLLTAAQQSSSGGGSGMPMPAASEQLQQMAREQAGLNGLADQLWRQLRQRGLSEETRAGMRRLQSEQGGLAGRLAELDRQADAKADGERILGDLRELAREMEQVAEELGTGRLDEEVLVRQERILGRLLDAHNSVRKRDFAQRRASRSALEPFAPQSGESAAADGAGRDDPYRRRSESVEKAPPDYRELVRRYFRALEALRPDAAGQAAPAPSGTPPGATGEP